MHAPSLPDLFHFATEEEEEDDDGHRHHLFIIPSTSSTFLTLLLPSFLRDCLERTCGIYVVPWADDDDVYLARMYFFPYFYGKRTAAVCKLGGYIFFPPGGQRRGGKEAISFAAGQRDLHIKKKDLGGGIHGEG